ncbi:MAG: radical SAM protein [Candidatus Daviesbacteria bacterium]|nr:radical SAM protein [Candidatus Daviesbacteria bacterium]
MILFIKSFVTKIPFSIRVYLLWRSVYIVWNSQISPFINSKEKKQFTNKIFFDRNVISKRKGPVVLVSRDIAFTFPLSYAYLAGYLKEKGIDVVLLFKDTSQEKLIKKIKSLKPILVGFGNLYPELEEITQIIHGLNKEGRDFPIVIGGQMFSPIPEFAMKLTGADYGVIGEGEIILHQLVKALQKNSDVSKIGGLVTRTKDVVTINSGGKYIDNLSKLPKIPYELFDVDKWLLIGRWFTQFRPEQPHWRFDDRVVNVHGGRGCPFKCNFCYHHNKPRYRDINDMMDEAEKALKRFDANMLYFSDDLVIANPARVKELIARVKKLKRPISYKISTRFDILERLSDELLDELHATGCRIIGLGVESGSNRILKLIGKNITSDKILKGLKRIKKSGILPTVSAMVGQYTETREDVAKTELLMKKAVKDNPLISFAFTITTPFPGSELYDILFAKKLLKNDEEFYYRYIAGKVGPWNQVVNMSAMSDYEVIKMRNELEKSYDHERMKAYGEERFNKISQICKKQRKAAEVFESKSKKDRKKSEKAYSAEQLELENEKLSLMGVV